MKRSMFRVGMAVLLCFSIHFSWGKLPGQNPQTENRNGHRQAMPELRLVNRYASGNPDKATIRLIVKETVLGYPPKSFQMLLDADHQFRSYIENVNRQKIDPDIAERLYNEAEETVPSDATYEDNQTAVPLGGQDSALIDPGMYDVFVVFLWSMSGNPPFDVKLPRGEGSHLDDIIFEAGQTYVFVCDYFDDYEQVLFSPPCNLELNEIMGEAKPQCELGSMKLSLSVSNRSNVPVAGYEVFYTVEGSRDTVFETVDATLDAGADTMYTFSKPVSLTAGELSVIRGGILPLPGETDIDDNYSEYVVMQREPVSLPHEIDLDGNEMYAPQKGTWRFEEGTITAVEDSVLPLFSSCFKVEEAGTYRLSFEHKGGMFVFGEYLTDVYRIGFGKSSENWETWPVVFTDSLVFREFTLTELSLDIEEAGDYAFYIYTEELRNKDELQFRNFRFCRVEEYFARINTFSIDCPRLIPEEHANREWTATIEAENRGWAAIDAAAIVLTVNGEEVTREEVQLAVGAKQEVELSFPTTGLAAGDSVVFAASIVRQEMSISDTAFRRIDISEEELAYDYVTADMYTKDYAMDIVRTDVACGLAFTLLERDTLTALSFGWCDLETDIEVGIALHKWNKEDTVLGDLIYETVVHRGIEGGQTLYEIPAFLLEPGRYMLSVRQTDPYHGLGLIMDTHPEGYFYMLFSDGKIETEDKYGYPAIRVVFGQGGIPTLKDVGITGIPRPIAGAVFSANEPVVVGVANKSSEKISVPVHVLIDGESLPVQTIEMEPYSTQEVTFTADLSVSDQDKDFMITAFTALVGDEDRTNDTVVKTVRSLAPADPYRMDFESTLDFAVEGFNPKWISLNLDGAATYPLKDVDFPGNGGELGFIAFNPLATTPSMLDIEEYYEFFPHSGERFGASFCAHTVGNNDWLISPKLLMPSAKSQLSLYVRSFNSEFGLEEYNILVSETDDDPESFTVLYPEDESVRQAPTEWTQVVVDLGDYNGKEIHVAIQCISDGKNMFMVDDIVLGASVSTEKADEEDFRLSLYPNPAKDMITVFSPDVPIREVSVCNPAGNEIYRSVKNLNTNDFRYNTNGLSAGVYFTRIKTDRGITVSKFIIL